MNKHETLLWKVDSLLAFVDLKVGLIAWILIDLYRSTMILDGIPGRKIKTVADVTHYIWENCGAPYLIWIPIVVVADIAVKRVLKGALE